MPANFYPGQTDYLRKLNDLALAKDVADIPRNAAAAAASAAAAGQAATSASADAVKASAQAASASAAFASLDARYLGAKALAPTSDNAGAALLAGATYWDTVLNGGCLRVFQAGAWVTIPTNAASQVVSTPVGGIVAKNVQAALAELDSKKAARATTLAGYGITDTSVIKADIGLDNVDNTSDANKPLSTPQQNAIPAIIKANLSGYKTMIGLTASRAITAADVGAVIYGYGADYSVTLPLPISIGAKLGDKILFIAIKGGAAQAGITLSPLGGGVLFYQTGLSSLAVMNGQQVELISDGTNTWQVGMCTARMNDNYDIARKAPIDSAVLTGVTKGEVFVAPSFYTGEAFNGQQSSLRSPPATGVAGSGNEVAAYGVAGIPGTNYAGRYYWETIPAAQANGGNFLFKQSYAMMLRATDASDNAITPPLLVVRGNGAVEIPGSLAVTGPVVVSNLNGSFIGGMQNRIINGDMRINQRGVPNSGTYLIGYGLDRWNYDASVAGKVAYGPNFYNVATRAPGFPNYLGLGSQGAYSASAIEAYLLQQVIEGNHLADLQYGTASAKTCTLSAWVYSNIAGSHSGALYNILANKSFVFSFSIPVANTWTKIAVSIPGDFASAMNTNNMQGLHLRFNLGSGANFVRPVTGTWITGNMTGVAGAVNMLANNGNFLITGVQFEVGTATPFSRRSMAEEMSLCIRYYCNSFPEGADVTVLAADALGLILSGGEAVDSLENNGRHTVKFPIPMRATPTINMRGYVGNPYSWACQGTAAQGGVQGFLGQAGEITNKYMKVKSNTSARQYNIQGNWEAIAEI